MFRALTLSSVTQPLSRPVPGETPEAYLAAAENAKSARRAGWRRLAYLMSGQDSFRLGRIPAGASRILWIYFGEDQIGDALMDLAPRSLLAEAGLKIDLWATATVASLFDGDPWFERVGSEASDFELTQYDCAIVLSNKRRPLEQKIRRFRRLPWVSLHESFTGPNFHRGAFVAQRLADLLGLALSDSELHRHALQKLRPLEAAERTRRHNSRSGIALVVGGVRSDRVYGRWSEVIRELVAAGQTDFALVGSANGVEEARGLVATSPPQARIVDLTGRLSLSETRAAIDAHAAIACPDGGLMHLTMTTGASLVPLFSAQIAPAWRLPATMTHALQATGNGVQGIPPGDVTRAILMALSAGGH